MSKIFNKKEHINKEDICNILNKYKIEYNKEDSVEDIIYSIARKIEKYYFDIKYYEHIFSIINENKLLHFIFTIIIKYF
jgi:hypothetical protein